MPKIADLYVEIGAKLDNFDRGMKSFQRSTKRMQSGLGGVAKRIVAIGLAYFGARGIFKMSKSFLEVAATVEQYNIRLKTLLGSQEAATEAMSEFQKIASTLPFTLDQVIESGIRLTTIKVPFKDWLVPIADVASAFGLDLPTATDQFARAMSAGLGAADWFREKGITAMIRDFAKLKFGIDDLAVAGTAKLREVMFEWAKTFKGSSEDMSKTWNGIISMLQDKWFQVRDAVMKAGVFENLKGALASFNVKIDEFIKTGKLDKWARDTAIAVLEAFKFIITSFQNIGVSFFALKAALIASTQEIISLLIKWSEFVLKVNSVTKLLGGAFKQEQEDLIKRIEFLKEVQGGLNTEYDEQLDKITALTAMFGPWIGKLKEAKEEAEKLKGVTSSLGEKTEEFGTKVAEVALPAARNFTGLIKEIQTEVESLNFGLEGLSEQGMIMFGSMVDAFAGGVMNMLDSFQRLGEEGGSVFATLGEAIQGFVSAALMALKRFTMEIIVSATKTVFAKQAEALAGVIASVMKSVPFPLNLLLVGGAMATVSALFSGLTPKKFEHGGFVPTETFAHLHAGERVLSAAEVRSGVGMEQGIGMGGRSMVVNPVINIYAQTLDQDTINRAGDEIYIAVERAGRRRGNG